MTNHRAGGKLPSKMRSATALVLVPIIFIASVVSCAASARIHSAPEEEPLSKRFLVKVNDQSLPVYIARVASADPARRWKAMDDKANSADYFSEAAFAYFDLQGDVLIEVATEQPINEARILPSSLKITPTIDGKTLRFKLTQPKPVTIEINGDWVGSLHLFANPPELNPPRKGDPNVLYFGPGIHEVSHLVVSNNQTVYIAGGAVVRGVIRPDEKYSISGYSGLRNYSPTFVLQGTNITFRGRGILDGSRSTTHARHLVQVQGADIRLEGVILRDSSTWTVPVRRSDRVTINNLKLLGYRANSDGIDICNSRNVTVDGCFIRTLDDLVVIKTDKGQGEARHIVVRNCVLWNEVAHALSIGAELRENVDDVLFTDCDVLHDKGREWTLRVFHSDSARISNVRFENLRIEESKRLISLWIDKAVWSRDTERGHIDGVTFRNISATADPGKVELRGFDTDHKVENVCFEKVTVNGKPLAPAMVTTNAFVHSVRY